MTTATEKLKTRAVAKTYGSFTALHPTDLSMAEGEFLTLLGPSGSGKTTLLSMIAGLSLPDGGEIWIDGRDATFVPPKKRDLGLVFQNYALFPHLSVFDNVAFPLRMRRRPDSEVRAEVARVLDIVRLGPFAQRLPTELSGGQQQRVALARCFVYRPSIILMDEPLGALDKKLREHMQIEIRRLSTEFGASVIYVTHDQEEALVMSDRICLLNEGRIEQIGTPHDLYFSPRTLFAAGFIGDSNLIAAQPAGADAAAIAGGVTLRCRVADPAARGPATLVLRPEYLRVLKPDDSAPNMLEATVEAVLLTGAMTRIHARLDDGTTIVAATPSHIAGVRLRPGDRARFGFDADVALLLPR